MIFGGILAITGAGAGGFLAGLLVGGCLGLLAGPVMRSWLAYREWERASREADVADRLLERMEADAARSEQRSDPHGTAAGAAWRPQP
ncbi:MAG: hypothetical protein ACRDG8_02620 [Actinomycetota bacterium]